MHAASACIRQLTACVYRTFRLKGAGLKHATREPIDGKIAVRAKPPGIKHIAVNSASA